MNATVFELTKITVGNRATARIHVGRSEDTSVPESEIFKGLAVTDRIILSDWLIQAGARGIDAVMDLSLRPWNLKDAAVIIGVFEIDKSQASWLVVRHGPDWTLARCADGFVSNVSESLLDILMLIDGDTNR